MLTMKESEAELFPTKRAFSVIWKWFRNKLNVYQSFLMYKLLWKPVATNSGNVKQNCFTTSSMNTTIRGRDHDRCNST